MMTGGSLFGTFGRGKRKPRVGEGVAARVAAVVLHAADFHILSLCPGDPRAPNLLCECAGPGGCVRVHIRRFPDPVLLLIAESEIPPRWAAGVAASASRPRVRCAP